MAVTYMQIVKPFFGHILSFKDAKVWSTALSLVAGLCEGLAVVK